MNKECVKKLPYFCPKPFEFFEVGSDGRVWVCCEDWLSTPIGNLHDQSFAQVWNSETVQEIRRSILDGSFKYCNCETCPVLVQRTLPHRDRVTKPLHQLIVAENLTVMPEGPRTLNLGYDNSCNLKCPTCRPEFIQIQGYQYEKAELLQKEIIRHGFKDAKLVIITGHGDAFGSRLFRNLLRAMKAADFPEMSVLLMTNGLLFTPDMWASIAGIQPAIRGVTVSIDAATAETYSVNRGGSFDKLAANLEFIATLHRDAILRWYEISFVVQANNFREMRDFVLWAQRLGCDSVLFQKLIRWPQARTVEQHLASAVHEPDHPQHLDFLRELQDPIFRDPMVDMSNLDNFLPTGEATGA